MTSLSKYFLAAALILVAGVDQQGLRATEIGLLVEYIEVERSTASQLIRDYDGDGRTLRLDLQKLINAGSADMIDSSYLHVREWNSPKVESINEFIYPTEYESPFGPDSITGKVAPEVNLIVPSAPTAFDVRYTGHMLEVKAEVAPGTDIVSLKISTSLAEHVRDETYGAGDSLAVQPTFDSLRAQTNVTARSGEYLLLAIHTPRAADDKVARDTSKRIFVMLRATILKADPPPKLEKEPAKKTYDPDDPFSPQLAEATNPIQIGTLVEYIKVDALAANRLARKHAADNDATKFRRRLDKLIADGRAEELDSCYIVTLPGKRAKTESAHELIYPTEYDPPSFGVEPHSFDWEKDPATGLPLLPLPPTAFDVRNVGSSLEVEPNIDLETKLISLNSRPQRVEFVDFLNYGVGQALSVQPVFFSLDSQNNVRVPSGGVTLLSMQMARDESAKGSDSARLDPAHRILVFAQPTLLEYAPADEKK